MSNNNNIQFGSIFADTINGKARLQKVYQASWLLNANYSPGSGDRTFAPGLWTLDNTFMNVNANSLVASNANYFAIGAPVQGDYSFTYHIRVSGNVSSSIDIWSYLALHNYNGISYTALGTVPPLSQRHSFFQSTFTSGSTNVVHTPSLIIELKAGDIVAPWFGCNGTSYSVQGSSSLTSASTRLSVALLKQTA